MVKAQFKYTGIGVRDLDRSIKFYTEKLGMQLMGRYKIKETNGEIADLKSPDGSQDLELNWYAHRKGYVNGYEVDHLAFRLLKSLWSLSTKATADSHSLKIRMGSGLSYRARRSFDNSLTCGVSSPSCGFYRYLARYFRSLAQILPPRLHTSLGRFL